MSRNCFFFFKNKNQECVFLIPSISTRARRWTLPGLEYTGHGVACSGATGRAAFVPPTALNVIRIHKCGFGTLKTVSSLGLAFYVHDLVKGNSRWIVIRTRINQTARVHIYIYVEYFSLVKDRKKMSKRIVLELGKKGRRGKDSMQRAKQTERKIADGSQIELV
ncbi:hypothetical protein NC651_003269 [Populus alba x Populus x berolinensis]|nr:hypothetical protein NC651_003269 [Populus alba x Populus x berolinensis]